MILRKRTWLLHRDIAEHRRRANHRPLHASYYFTAKDQSVIAGELYGIVPLTHFVMQKRTTRQDQADAWHAGPINVAIILAGDDVALGKPVQNPRYRVIIFFCALHDFISGDRPGFGNAVQDIQASIVR